MRSAGPCRRAPGYTRRGAHPSCRRLPGRIPAGSWLLGPRRLGDRLLPLPALPLRERPVLDDADLVPDAARVGLVVRHEPRVAAYVLFVLRIAGERLDPKGD